MAEPKATLANWRTAPHNRWAFHHVRELVPSADIPNDPRKIRPLPEDLADFAQWRPFIEGTDTDGLLVLHRGRVAFEYSGNGMTDETPHILMSVSKSMLGLLFHLLGLDPERRVGEILPGLEGTAYRGAKLRHLLDMRAGIAFNEDYLATSGPIIQYRKATGWNPLEPGESPSDLHSFYQVLKEKDGEHGGRFHYVSPNTDLLGWVIEEATGRRQWMIEAQAGFLDDLEANGDPQAWAAGDLVQYYPGLPMRYRNHWYVLDGEAPLAFGMGIHGQNLFIDRIHGIVIAKLSSQALPLDAERIALTMRAVSEMRKRLAHA